PIEGRFDPAHLKAIHKHIFQDVYSWAGQFRSINISKGGHLFGSAAFVEPALQDTLRKLSAEKFLRGADPESFAARAAFYLGEINAAHPFRDGNGRAQLEFIRELGLQTGFLIDWSQASREDMMSASRGSARRGDSFGLAALIRGCILTTDS